MGWLIIWLWQWAGAIAEKGLWMGLRSNTPAHNDYADNMVCNVYGTRRITLFPQTRWPIFMLARSTIHQPVGQ